MSWMPLNWINPKYHVSIDGQVRSSMRNTPKLLNPTKDRYGYLRIELVLSTGEPRKFYVHRLVLQAFTNTEGEQCNHKDGVKVNNALSNLEWCTASENVTHAYRVLHRDHPRPNLNKFGVLSPKHRGVVQMLENGDPVKVWGFVSEVTQQGFSRQCVTHVCNGRQNTHRGFKWQYVS